MYFTTTCITGHHSHLNQLLAHVVTRVYESSSKIRRISTAPSCRLYYQVCMVSSACLPFMALLSFFFRITPMTHYFLPPTIPPIAHDHVGLGSAYTVITSHFMARYFGGRLDHGQQSHGTEWIINPWPMNAVSMDKCGCKAR